MIKNIPSPKIFFVVAVVLILQGCGIWADFTTYFNLYYNARDSFQEAEIAIRQQRKNLLELEEPNISGNVPQLLNKVIEKCSKILQFHEKSSYVDNALLMLGKSFYYQKNYQKALRKFQELVVTRPESNLILENDLWIAKTQMKLKDFKNGLLMLKRVRDIAADAGEDEILSDAYVEEIIYLINTDNYSQAISLMNEFLDASHNDEVNAELVYEMGRLYAKTDDIENAISSFRRVMDYSPSFEIELKSQIELAIALRENQQDEESLSILKTLLEKESYSESFDKIELETGLTLFALDRVEDAVSMLIKVDTSYSTSSNSGIAKFKLGQIFEYHYKNFDSASTFYNRAASSTAPPEYSKPASEKAQLFNKYKTIQKAILDSKKQLIYLEDPEAFIKDSLDYYSDTLTTEEQNVQTEFFDEGRNFGDEKGIIPNQPPRTQIKTDPKKNPPKRPTISADSLKQIILKNEFDLANLYYTELNVPDSAYRLYKNIVDNYPESIYYLRSLYSLGIYYNSIGSNEEADSIFNFIYENYRNESIANAAAIQIKKPLIDLNYDPADSLYLEAERKLLENKFGESVRKFYNIFLTYPQSPTAPKALYAGGWVLENKLNLLDSAAVLYDSVEVKYPQSQFASVVRAKLAYYKQEIAMRKQAIEDSLKHLEVKEPDNSKTEPIKQNVDDEELLKEKLKQQEEEFKNLDDEELKQKELKDEQEEFQNYSDKKKSPITK